MKGLLLRTVGLVVALGGSVSSGEPAASSLDYVPYVLTVSEGLPNGLTGRLKANGRSTRGNYSVVVRESQNSQAADAHTHSHLVEAWYVVEGTMTFQSRGTVIESPAGTFVLVPPGVEHGFKIAAGRPVKLVQVFSPPGFENLFSERLKLPSYDPGKDIGQQSPQWKADQKDIARKYGAGPAEQASNGLPIVRKPAGVTVQRTLATASETAGRYTLQELTFAPGITPRLPTRENDQAWYLLSGELHLDWKSGGAGRKAVLKPGDFVFVPRGTAFSVSNPVKQNARALFWESSPRELNQN